MPHFLPLGQLPYNLFHRNLTQLYNISIAFRNGNKLIRRAILISNTHKRFKAYNFSGLTVHLRLIYHIEGILLNGILHDLQNLTDFFFFVSKFLTIEYQTVFSLPFCKAHGQSGVHDNRPRTFPAYGRSHTSRGIHIYRFFSYGNCPSEDGKDFRQLRRILLQTFSGENNHKLISTVTGKNDAMILFKTTKSIGYSHQI